MYELVKFKGEHLLEILSEPDNISFAEFYTESLLRYLEAMDSVTYFKDGKVQFCGGITPYWPGRGQIWIMFSEETRKNFVPTFRTMKKWVDEMLKSKYHRIECSIDHGFEQGKRRVLMLGFKLECELLRKYLPNEGDVSLYSMVRD